MRTKALLALAALAIAIPASAQVYSANIVGYVNVPLAGNGALTLVSNPLKPANGDYNVTNTMALPGTWDGAFLYKWTGTGWDSNVPTWYDGFGWYPDTEIALGEAFFIQAPAGSAATTLTLVGEVQTGTVPTTIATGMNFIAPKMPLGAAYPGSAVGNDGNFIYQWTGSAWDSTVWTYYDGYGWFGTGDPGEGVNGPTIPVGGGIAYENAGAPIAFDETFNP